MEKCKRYFIDGTAILVHPFDPSRYPGQKRAYGKGRAAPLYIEVARFELPTFTVELKGVAEWFGFELSRLVVDEGLDRQANTDQVPL